MESFTTWKKEQWKEVVTDMKKRLRTTVKHMRKLASKPLTIIKEEEGEASRTAAVRLARWASQLSPSKNPAISPSPKNSIFLLLHLCRKPKTHELHHHLHPHYRLPQRKEDINVVRPRVQKEDKGRNTLQ
jgi:hypothetical protein